MNGINIPKIGLGTWFIPDDEAATAVCKAVEIGYRHIDTAQAYENERGIGKGVRDCGISRQELFITTKLAAELKTYEEAAQAITGSLEKIFYNHYLFLHKKYLPFLSLFVLPYYHKFLFCSKDNIFIN